MAGPVASRFEFRSASSFQDGALTVRRYGSLMSSAPYLSMACSSFSDSATITSCPTVQLAGVGFPSSCHFRSFMLSPTFEAQRIVFRTCGVSDRSQDVRCPKWLEQGV